LTAFYRHLGKGASVAAALSAAQRDRFAAGAPPRAWASLTVLGDGGIVPLPGGKPRSAASGPLVSAGAAGAAALLLAFFLRRRLGGRWNGRSRG
ncbi:MAG TPA: hypothetical protein VMM92_13735, partial [Thermoanaerobaculia bacterium]|nr:hypothetical protein [Thermoanaerobaculia bacterium]